MLSDFITFLTGLPSQVSQTGSVLPTGLLSGIRQIGVVSSYLDGINNTIRIVGIVISLIIALAGCFFGYRLYRFFIGLAGFIIGAIIGIFIGGTLLSLSGVGIVICALIGAVLLAIFSARIAKAGIFILCFGLAFTIAAALLPITGDLQFFLSVVIGLLIGILAVRFLRPVIILSSAIVCGFWAGSLLVSLGEAAGVAFLASNRILLTIVLILLGILVQFLTTKGDRRRRRRRARRRQRRAEQAAQEE